ncbi:MAG: MBL fold metallo-hydrolase [Proteobacteria bacterium]|jgi:metallo-beta-lactamase class B|nr:MBL fold metallo-hydrolase [Pseudomonadota bacterium]
MKSYRICAVAAKFSLAAFLSLMTSHAAAQENPVDSAETTEHINAARDIAGSQWEAAFNFVCTEAPEIGGRDQSPIVEPTKIFDNLSVLGRSGTVVYALDTSEGIILIDSGYPGQEESVLLAGLESLGFNPQDIKIVIVAHGHADHYGGARYLQEQYGARIVLAEADWQMIEAAASEDGTPPIPARDVVATEGVPITLGDTQVLPTLVPGHTPGSLGLVFQVQDGDAEHTAALFGGTILLTGRISSEGLHQYVDSLAHFSEMASDMGVEVEISNHPIFNNFPAQLAALKTKADDSAHPFVIGEQAYQSFLGVISECTKVKLARRGDL